MTPPALPDLPDLRRLPHWLGPALLAVSIAAVALGRRGLRLTNAAIAGCGFFCAALFGLRGAAPSWVPGFAAVVGGAVGVLLGLTLTGVGTGLVLAAFFGALTIWVAPQLGLAWPLPAAAAAAVAFSFGVVARKRLALVVTPLCAALLAALGVQQIWRPRFSLEAKVAATALLAAVLLALSFAREHRARRIARENAKRIEDEELRRRVAEKQAEYRRTYGPE